MANTMEALGWVGHRIDDVYGARVGKVEDLYVNERDGRPVWVLARLGRFGDYHALVPVRDAVAAPDGVWVPYERQQIKAAPPVPLGVPLTRERELALARHYGFARARAGELGEGPGSEVTASLTGAARAAGPAFAGH